MVDSMYQSFLLKPEVLTPNRNGIGISKLEALYKVHSLEGRGCDNRSVPSKDHASY